MPVWHRGLRLRRWLLIGLGFAILLPTLALVACAAWTEFPSELQESAPEQSVRFEDRQGQLLREVRASTGTLSQWIPLAEVPSLLVTALVAIEDRRFYLHPGVDPLALLRAVAQTAYRGRIVSGASTL